MSDTKETVKPLVSMPRMVAVKQFLAKDAKPIDTKEFSEFWKSCNDEDRNQYAACAAESLGVKIEG